MATMVSVTTVNRKYGFFSHDWVKVKTSSKEKFQVRVDYFVKWEKYMELIDVDDKEAFLSEIKSELEANWQKVMDGYAEYKRKEEEEGEDFDSYGMSFDDY